MMKFDLGIYAKSSGANQISVCTVPS